MRRAGKIERMRRLPAAPGAGDCRTIGHDLTQCLRRPHVDHQIEAAKKEDLKGSVHRTVLQYACIDFGEREMRPAAEVRTGRRAAVLRALLGAAVLGNARAQVPHKPRRSGVLAPDPSDASGAIWEAFVNELARRGHVEGQNIAFDVRAGQGDRADLLAQRAAELVAAKVDLIYAARGTASALAAKAATTTIPIVFYSANDPVDV
ncbi:MAG TPA: ABC transporter substrate binding protein, partial [Burkholderiaceae bacterium]